MTEHHRKLVLTTCLPIRWGDQDAMEHVNNTIYFRYMEQARIEWLEALGYGTALTRADGPVIVNASCSFIIPFTYPGTIECRMYAGTPGRSSVPTYYERAWKAIRGCLPRVLPNWYGSIPRPGNPFDCLMHCAQRQVDH